MHECPYLPEKQPEDFGSSAGEMVRKGECASRAKGYVEAMQFYKGAAGQGNTVAMRNISELYAAGLGVAKDDAEAMRWLRKAADLHNVDALNSIGSNYERGEGGVAQDYAEAMRWYRKAADLGNADAIYHVGFLYKLGHDDAEAIRWYRKSADLGNMLAIYSMGVGYQFGSGVPHDFVRAYMWYDVADAVLQRRPGDSADRLVDTSIRDEAVMLRDELAAKMSRAQIAEAQKLAREWKPTLPPPR